MLVNQLTILKGECKMSSKEKTSKAINEAIKDTQTISKEEVGNVEDVLNIPNGISEPAPVSADPKLTEVELLPTLYLQLDLPAQINALVGNPQAGGWPALVKQLGIMRGEWNELVGNVENQNYETLADDVCDLLFTLIGFTHAAGLMSVFQENWFRVCGSQYGKFDRSPDEAARTVDKYAKKGIKAHTELALQNGITYYITKSSIDQPDPDRNGDLIKAGKWLKSVNFQEATLDLPPAEVQAKFAVAAKA